MSLRTGIMILFVLFTIPLPAGGKPESAPSPWLMFDKLAAMYPEEGKRIEELRSSDPAVAAAKLEKLIRDEQEHKKNMRKELDRAARAAAADPQNLPEFRVIAGEYYDKLVRERDQFAQYLEGRIRELKEKNVSPGVIAREERNLQMIRTRKIARASSREEYVEMRVRSITGKKKAPKKRGSSKPVRDEEK